MPHGPVSPSVGNEYGGRRFVVCYGCGVEMFHDSDVFTSDAATFPGELLARCYCGDCFDEFTDETWPETTYLVYGGNPDTRALGWKTYERRLFGTGLPVGAGSA